MKRLDLIFLLILFLMGCSGKEQPNTNGAFAPSGHQTAAAMDFDQIQTTGEVIVTTLSGPDTYYEYQGRARGLQYALVSHFARVNGLRLRVELSHSITEMITDLQQGDVDIISYPLPDTTITAHGLQACGVVDTVAHTSWAVRASSPLLAKALDDWFAQGIIVTVERTVTEELHHSQQSTKKIHSPYISKEKGIISPYDNELKSAAYVVGWDWRLLAAQCYQESGFDQTAVSWAGARGLMQIMPSVAKQLKLPESQIFNPRENIAAAARFLKELDDLFSAEVRSPSERLKFVLAAYNGGAGHVHDAMALARKYGHQDKFWEEVAPYILKLSEAAFYRDPVVKHGYMVGSETYQYVNAIVQRWHNYCSLIHPVGHAYDLAAGGRPSPSKNRFTKPHKIYQPTDPAFKNLEE